VTPSSDPRAAISAGASEAAPDRPGLPRETPTAQAQVSSARAPVDGAVEPSLASRRRWLGAGGWLQRAVPWVILALMMAAFFAVTLDVAWASYLSVVPEGNNGAVDLSIMMQALSSTAHGYIPFYESPDCVHTARCSLLLVHPTLLFFAVVPVYGADPTPLVLFTLQSAAVALAAVPLYFIARDVTRSRTLALLTSGVYLIYLPTISSIGFSFHIEPLLPLELFTLFWLWMRGRYWMGAAVAVLSFVTLEVTPVIVFFFGVFFLWPFVFSAGRELFHRIQSGESAGEVGGTARRQLRAFVRSPTARPARAAVLLMGMGVVAYVSLRLFVEHSTLFGLPPLPPVFLLPLGRPNPQVTYSFVLAGARTASWFVYWTLAFALLGFVGFLAPRTLLLAAPWVGYTLFTVSPNYTMLGLHYGVMAAIPLLIGFAYGLAKLPLRNPPPAAATRTVRRRWRARRTAAWALVAGVVAVNLVLTPLGPLAGPLASSALPVSPYYPTTVAVTPGVAAIEGVVSEIPSNGIVLAPTLLLPYVANDIYAYPLPPGKSINLPYHVGAYPTFLLADPGAVDSLDPVLAGGLYNTSVYTVRAIAPETPVGLVTLFAKGYAGNPTIFGANPPLGTVGFSPNAIGTGGNSTRLMHSSSVPYGSYLESRNTSVAGQAMFAVPAPALMPGSYQIDLLLQVKNTTNSTKLGPNYLALNVTGFNNLPILNESLAYADAPVATWFNATADFNLTEPMYSLQITGYLTSSLSAYQVKCAGVWLTEF
jgi:uncharacterized membrane protein